MDKLTKELEDTQGKRMPIVLGIIVLFILVGLFIASTLSSVPADKPKDKALLYVDDVFFVLSGSYSDSGSDKVTLDVTTFITNKGTADAKDVKIIAFVIEENSNIAMDKTTHDIGSITKDKTKSSEFSLTMPNNDSYTIKLILFENGKIAVRGSGTVNLDMDNGGRGTRFTSGGEGDGDYDMYSEYGEAFSASSFSMIILLAGAVFIIIMILIKRRAPATTMSPRISSSIPENGESEQNIFTPPVYQVPEVVDDAIIQSEDQGSSMDDESEASKSEEERG